MNFLKEWNKVTVGHKVKQYLPLLIKSTTHNALKATVKNVPKQPARME
jgi:hypothetical protein